MVKTRYIAICMEGAGGCWGRGDTIEEAKAKMAEINGGEVGRYVVYKYEWDTNKITCPEGETDEPLVNRYGRTSFYGTETEVESTL